MREAVMRSDGRRTRCGGWLATAAVIAVCAFLPPVRSLAATGNVTLKWSMQTIIKVTLTPNYYVGFGTVPAVFGTQPTPAPGPAATLDGGSVDFGNVLSGKDYLYKYAVQLTVTTNSSTGFNLYGEGAADFYNINDNTTQPLDQTLYYLPSTNGVTPDPNTGFSPSLPFYQTSGAVSGGSFTNPPTITYTTYPAPIASSSVPSQTFYYDYQLKVPPSATAGTYYVWVVYTVVAQ
jgi:hypothetical protein